MILEQFLLLTSSYFQQCWHSEILWYSRPGPGAALAIDEQLPSAMLALWKLVILWAGPWSSSNWLMSNFSSSSFPRSRTTGMGLPRTWTNQTISISTFVKTKNKKKCLIPSCLDEVKMKQGGYGSRPFRTESVSSFSQWTASACFVTVLRIQIWIRIKEKSRIRIWIRIKV